MSNPNPKLRNALGISALTAFSLAMIGCGGSSSSAPTVSNTAPINVTIAGANTAVQYHASLYNLSAIDPEGDTITFSTTTAGATISGSVLTFTPTVVAPASAPAVISVIATDSKSAASAVKTISVIVTPNTPAHFTSTPPTAPLVVGQTLTYTPVCELDPERDTITITKTSTAGTFTGGVFTYTPTLAEVGPVTVTFAATDGFTGGGTTQTFTLTVVSNNTKPNITTANIPEVHLNHNISQQLTATDDGVGGSTLVWTLTSPVAGFSLSPSGLLTSSTSTLGPRTLTVRVTDVGGLFDEKTFSSAFLSDSKPNFSTQTYTETVAGVQFHDPANLRQEITGYNRFNFLDTSAANAEYTTLVGNKGWRAGVTATDAENDQVIYSVKTNSVFRFGSPFVATTDSNAAPAGGRYPYVVPGPSTDTSSTGVVRNPGEIVWRPGYALGNPGTDGTVMGTGLNADALLGAIDPGFPIHDPANWSFTIIADQMIGGVITPGQSTETTLVIKVQPNHQPSIGALTTINIPAITAGVNTGSGTAVSPNVGRPAIQEPVASDTSTPGTASKWIWAIGAPGTAGSDTNIADPNTNANHGHQDAIQVFFGNAPYNTANGIGVLSATAGNYPAFDTTNNYPAVLTSGTIPNGFYNPWLGAIPAPATYTVAWAPVRIQYQLGRYLACAYGVTNGYNFPLKVEDQYTLSSTNAVSIFPIFGTVKLFNARYRFMKDNGADGYQKLRGNFLATSNYRTTAGAYVFAYLPLGISAGAGNAEILAAGVSTYGSKLFGNPTAPTGAPASGYGSAAGGYITPNSVGGGPTAGNWHTLDAVNTGNNWALSTGNPLNPTFNPAASAAAVPGTVAGATKTYTQFTGPVDNPVGIPVTVSGPYADNEVDARKIPSNSPYLFSLLQVTSPYGAGGAGVNDGYTAGQPRYPDLPNQPTLSLPNAFPREHIADCTQSEVNIQKVLAGRPMFYSQYRIPPAQWGIDSMALPLTPLEIGATLRLSFTWPTNITNTADGYPDTATANTWGETDIMQVATPNIGGRARFFFTGNYNGATETAPTNFWKLGFYSANAGGGPVQNGVTNYSYGIRGAVTQPIHVVTNSIWVPATTSGHFNMLNTLTTPAGGSGYTDLTFAGVRGYLDGVNYPVQATMTAIPDTGLWLGSSTAYYNLCTMTNGWYGNTTTGYLYDFNNNPALLDTGNGDRTFFLWMKQEGPDVDAYGTYAGSYLDGSGTTPTLAVGGHTAAPNFAMTAKDLTDTQSQISFSLIGTQLAGDTQLIDSGIGMTTWKRTQFEGLKALVAAPGQYGQAPRARLVDPESRGAGSNNSVAAFDNPGTQTWDGIVSNSLIAYAVRNRGILGEAGIEASSPVLAQWWNTGHTDVDTADFPKVLATYNNSFLPAGQFTEVIELKHNFIGKLAAPSAGTTDVQKVILSTGIIAPKGDSLLDNAIPVVTPVRQLAINDLKINTATGNTAVGTKLDIFNGSAELSINGAQYGVPAGGLPSYKLTNGNSLPASDYRLHGNSTLQLTFQPAVNDLRQPSGYEVTIYQVFADYYAPGQSGALPMHVIRMPHKGGIGAIQTLNFPNLWDMTYYMDPSLIQPFAVKVRNIWMTGTEGAASHSFDMAKEPGASRFPMAWADCLSGVFVVDFTAASPIAHPTGAVAAPDGSSLGPKVFGRPIPPAINGPSLVTLPN